MRAENIEPTSQIASEGDIGSPTGTSTPRRTAEQQPPAKECRHSIRLRLVCLCVACVLPICIAAGFLIYHDYQSRRALTEQRMLETARALAMVVDRELATMQASLNALATSPSLASGDLSAFYRQARVVREAYPGAEIVLADATGQQLINTILPFGAPLPKRNVPDAVRQIYTTGRPIITKAFKGAVTGHLIISVDVPVFRDGRTIYDLALSTSVDRFTTILLQQQLSPEWLVRIYDSDQVTIARTRLAEKLAEQYVGRKSGPILAQRMREASEGTAETISFDGIPMFDTFSRSAKSGWTVAIGVPKAILMAEIWHWLWWTIACTALLSLAGIALAWPIARNVERIERGSRRMSAIVESSDDAIIGETLEGVITSWNLGAARLYGYSAAEITGQPISVLIPADRPDEGPKLLQRIINDERVDHYETVRRRRDGSFVDVSLTISPIRGASGNIVGASSIARDITERKRAELQLRETAERLTAILEHAPVGIVIADHERFLETNAAFQRMTGYSAEELKGMSFQAFTHPEDRSRDRDLVNRLMRGKAQSFAFEKRYVLKDGKMIWVRVISSRLDDQRNVSILEDVTEHKRAQESLRKGEERFRELFETMTEGFALHKIVTDAQGQACDYQFLDVNPAFERLTGKKRHDLIGKRVREVLPDIEPHWIEDYGKVALTGEPLHKESFSGNLQRWYDVSAYRTAPDCFAVLFSDITERKRTEEVTSFLAQTGSGMAQEPFFNALARYLAESLQMDFVCIDRLEGDGLTARTLAMWYDGDFQDNVTYALKDTPCGDVVEKKVCCFREKVRHLFPEDSVLQEMGAESYVGTTLWSSDGKPIGLIAVIGRRPLVHPQLAQSVLQMVATRAAAELEHQQAEQALRESEDRFRRVVEGAPVGMYIQTDGRVRYLNATALAMFGAEDASQIVNQAILDRIHPDSRAAVEERFRMAKEKEVSIPFLEERLVRLDGTTFDAEVNANPFIFNGSRGQIVFVRDITGRKREENERRKLEEQLRQSQKMEAVGRLSGGIAHDFNNLLMVIQTYTEMLQGCLPDGDARRRNTQAIMKAADRAAGLTRQMLAFSRRQIISPVVLDLNAVIDETAKMLKRLIGEDIEFRVTTAAESLWAIEADSDQIVQVLMNLCVNARDAMPSGGTLTIATENVTVEEESIEGRPYVASGDYVKLTVSDNGMGMSTEIQERIFEPFFTTKEVGAGTGLGLATVYGIVKQSSGYVWVDSEPGQGACFTIYLPRAGRTITPETPDKSEERPRRTATLLVAEDEEALREAVCGYLRSLGYTVLEADSGQGALSIASQHGDRIDLLITDLVMPKMNGRELSQSLTRLCPELKTIFMSGYTDDVLVRHGINEMEAIFLQKPFSLAALACKVRDTL